LVVVIYNRALALSFLPSAAAATVLPQRAARGVFTSAVEKEEKMRYVE
jgi:hypothetical protein